MIEKCPACSNQLTITRLFCVHCGTTLTGQFGSPHSSFSNLTNDQLDFLLAFIRCEGKFNRLEEELKLSYPTLRNRFNEILAAMGFSGESPEDKADISKQERLEILMKLNTGEIKPEQAELLLRGKPA